VATPGRFRLEIPMSFLRHFKAALLFGVPRWVLARSLGYQEAAAIDLSAPVQVIGSRAGR
jgi:hypothetical protein